MMQFEQMIGALMSTDNSVRSQAEEAFNQAKANADVLISGLITLLRTKQGDEMVGVRSMCAILLRKTIMQSASSSGSLIKTLSPAVLKTLQEQLILAIQEEPQRTIRKKVCDAVGQLAINLLSADMQAWPELLPFMLGATKSGNVNLHEAALMIFNALSDFMADKQRRPYAATLQEVFTFSLQADQAMQVRIAALKALASFLLALEESSAREPFQGLVPLMLQAISDALAAGDEAEVRTALEVFVEIAESQPKFLRRNVVECVQGMIAISSNADLEDATRHLALEFLLTIAENAGPTARKIGTFCQQVVPVALGMMLEIECDTAEELAQWEQEEEDEEDTEITNYDVGEEALDRLAIAMGGKAMVPVLFEKIQQLIKSADWKQRHAALMAISQSGEGCEKQMAENLASIVTMIVGHFADQHPRVRWAAINTVGQMCTDFGPKLQQDLHSSVLPALIQAMDDGCARVQAHAAAAVINFCEHCTQSTLDAYLQPLLGKLLELLQRGVRRVCEQAVTAIASVADVAEDKFAPYYASFIPGLKGILRGPPAKETRMLRGKAMECISLIGVAVGKEAFGSDAKEVMDLILQSQASEALEADDPQVAFMLQACGRICKCLGEHFQPYLPMVLPPLLRSAQIDPELHVTDADDDDGDDEAEEGLESVTVAIRGQGNKRITIRTSALEEKATACAMLRTYAQELKEAFFPYVQQIAGVLVPLIGFQYMDEVRTGAMSAMPELLGCAIAAAAKGNQEAMAMIGQLKEYMVGPILEQLQNEPDTETLAMLLDSWNEVIAHGGEVPSAQLTAEQLAKSIDVCRLLLDESAQRKKERAGEVDEVDEEEEEALADEAEREEVLVQNVVESIGALLKVYHSTALPLFDAALLPIAQQMLQPTAIATDRVAALCIFDDIIEHCSADGAANRYVPVLFPAFLQYSTDATTEVRQAAVYGLGVMSTCSNDEVFPDSAKQQAAQALLAMIEKPDAFDEDNASASDNAVSALGKLCKRSAGISEHCLPRWLRTLPLETDKEEARVVHKMLIDLCMENNTQLLGTGHERLADVIVVFGQVLGTDLIEADDATRIGAMLQQVRTGLPHVLQGLTSHPGFAKLTLEQRASLERAISG